MGLVVCGGEGVSGVWRRTGGRGGRADLGGCPWWVWVRVCAQVARWLAGYAPCGRAICGGLPAPADGVVERSLAKACVRRKVYVQLYNVDGVCGSDSSQRLSIRGLTRLCSFRGAGCVGGRAGLGYKDGGAAFSVSGSER